MHYDDKDMNLIGLAGLTLANSVMLVWSIAKVLFFLQINDRLSFLIRMVSKCLRDVLPFIGVLSLWIVVFSLLFIILGIEINKKDFHHMHQFPIQLIQNFQNSQGDIKLPVYDSWLRAASTKNEANMHMSHAMIAFVWIFWAANQFFLGVILMNFAIGIVTETYDEVMSKEKSSKFLQKCTINREASQLLQGLGIGSSLESFVLATEAAAAAAEPNDWEGIASTVQKFIVKENGLTTQKIAVRANESKSMMENAEKKIRQSIRRDMTTVNTQIEYALTGVSQLKEWMDAEARKAQEEIHRKRNEEMRLEKNARVAQENGWEQTEDQEVLEQRERHAKLVALENRLTKSMKSQLKTLKIELRYTLE